MTRMKGGPGNKREIYRFRQFLEIDIGQVFQPEGEAQGVELAFLVTAVHRGDIHGDMAFVVNALLCLEGFF